jgi:dephospho-CoA kinase
MMQIEENYPDFRAEHITTLFLNVPDEIMVERMKHRDSTISEKEIQNRLNSAKKEREFRKNADHIIITSDITPEEVLEKVLNIINK